MNISLLKQVLATTNKIALGTSIDGKANVKIVNFVWFDDTPDTLYFSSVRGTNGVSDYDKNPNVAIITIPNSDTIGNPYVRTQHVTLQHSNKVMEDLLPRYLETIPNYQQVWDLIGPKLQVFELKLHDVYVDPGLGKDKETLNF